MHKKTLVFTGIFLFLFGIFFWIYSGIRLAQNLAQDVQHAGTDPQKWESIFVKARQLPPIVPTSGIRDIFLGLEDGFRAAGTILESMPQFGEPITATQARNLVSGFHRATSGLERIHSGMTKIPQWVLSDDKQDLFAFAEDEVVHLLDFMRVFGQISTVIDTAFERQSRVLILLQNTNEARPTGGFVGSILILDFNQETIEVRFEDIYALDRLVPQDAVFPAPEYYHPITQVISLRDSNMYPEFHRSADLYRSFFRSIGEKEPDIVAAVSLEVIRELMALVDAPLELEKWNITMTPENADLLLSFLVESKAAGRMEVKTPVMDFGKQLVSQRYLGNVSLKKVFGYDWEAFFDKKMVLAHSTDPVLETIFEQWGITHDFSSLSGSPNFLSLDFTSLGANKSDRFMENNIRHTQRIHQNGRVENLISIKRTHTGTREKIEDLLGKNTLPENLAQRIDGETLWKLGSGENRSMIRLFLPFNSSSIRVISPSGDGYTKADIDGRMNVVHIPANVLPNESLEIEVHYDTFLDEGSSAWRPYEISYLNPAGQNVSLSSVVSAADDGVVLEKSFWFGVPHGMVEEVLRAVISFE